MGKSKLSDEVEAILTKSRAEEEKVLRMMREVKDYIHNHSNQRERSSRFEKDYPAWKQPFNEQ